MSMVSIVRENCCPLDCSPLFSVIKKIESSRITQIFWKIIYGLVAIFQIMISPIYALFDEGIGNLLGLQILRHGTSFPNYVHIITNGADANLGGGDGGSSYATGNPKFIDNSRGYLHVFNDSYAAVKNKAGKILCSPLLNDIWSQTAIRAAPRVHSTLSGMASFSSKDEWGITAKVKKVAGGILGFFTPTIRFKFTPEQVKMTFEEDPDYGGLAMRTRKNIGTEHIGILGSLVQGVNLQVFQRIAEYPLKFLLGLIQVISAIALSAIALAGTAFLVL